MSTQRPEKKSASARRRERELWLLFLYVFLPLGLSYVNWASQECCLFYLRSSLQSSDLPLFYFRRLFSSYLLATAILDSFPYSNYLTLYVGEGNGNLLQYPCLENPMDRETGMLESMGSQRVRHD